MELNRETGRIENWGRSRANDCRGGEEHDGGGLGELEDRRTGTDRQELPCFAHHQIERTRLFHLWSAGVGFFFSGSEVAEHCLLVLN